MYPAFQVWKKSIPKVVVCEDDFLPKGDVFSGKARREEDPLPRMGVRHGKWWGCPASYVRKTSAHTGAAVPAAASFARPAFSGGSSGAGGNTDRTTSAWRRSRC